MRAIAVVGLALILHVPSTLSGQDAATDRDILMELFRATDGQNWKRKAGWGSEAPVCSWDGVLCFFDAPKIDELQLSDNNLRGILPESLTRLAGLKRLNVAQNKLTGKIPAALLARADAYELDFNFGGNLLAESIAKIAMVVESTTGVCSDDHLEKFSMEFDVAANKAIYQSERCPGRNSRSGFACRRIEMPPPLLDDVSRAFRHLKFPPPERRGLTMVSHHGEYIDLTVEWGDGRSEEDSRAGGRAAIESWIAYELLLGLEPRDWEARATRVDCDAMKWPEW